MNCPHRPSTVGQPTPNREQSSSLELPRCEGGRPTGQHNGKIISKDVIADLHTTEFFLRCAMKASKGRAPNDAHAYGQGDERVARRF